MTTFIRVIEAQEKATALQEAIRDAENALDISRFETDPASFCQVPGSPFAYWVSTEVRRLFANHPGLESRGRRLSIGASTKNDFRYVRLAFEVPETAVCNRRQDTAVSRWVPFAKGGSFSPFFADIHLLIDWQHDGSSLKADISEYRGSRGWGYQWSAALNGHSHYFRPGLTWPRRTQAGLSLRAMPAGCIFADKGPGGFVEENDRTELLAILALTNSKVFAELVELQMAFGSYEVGVLQRTPVPEFSPPTRKRLAELAHTGWSLSRTADSHTETSHAFVLPALLQVVGISLLDRVAAFVERTNEMQAKLNVNQSVVDDLCFALYGITGGDRKRMERGFHRVAGDEGQDDQVDSDGKKAVVIETKSLVTSLLSWTVGVSFGRFDIRLATGERDAPVEPEPFDALPLCSPGMLTGTNGLPMDQEPDDYTVHFPHDGVLVDDQGHNFDLVARTRQVFQVVFGEDADTIWREAGEVIDKRVTDLRRWFAASFFADHIKRYSKSRRKAPVYWQISTPSARYSVWLYYQRFTKDTFYKILQDYVAPKSQHEERKLEELRSEAEGYPTAAQRREIESQETFVDELNAFREEVARVAPLWNPNLNDGAIINFAPLWRLTPQHRSWQRECKSVWDKLVAGDYDWAHLAMHLWPERVTPKCADDRSLAIAHGLDNIFWYEDIDGKWHRRNVQPSEVKALIKERTSPAVQEALKKLLEAPAPRVGGAGRKSAVRRTATGTRPAAPVLDTTRGEERTGEQSPRPGDDALVVEVRNVIAGNGVGTSKSDVIEATGITSGQWSRVVKTLLADGTVSQTGERRGARYRIAGADE